MRTIHHRLGEQGSIDCGLPLSQFPSMAFTTDIALVTCKNCLAEIERRKEEIAPCSDPQVTRSVPAADAVTKDDITELRILIERNFRDLAVEILRQVPRRYMNVDECATYIGRSAETVRRMADDRVIPHIRFDRRLTFDREKIDRWMERHGKRGARLLI